MLPLSRYGEPVVTVFDLLKADERGITASVGWALANSSSFAVAPCPDWRRPAFDQAERRIRLGEATAPPSSLIRAATSRRSVPSAFRAASVFASGSIPAG